jgi:hypothetical protein
MVKFNPKLNQNQSGVTLLLAVFVVSTLTLVAVTVSVLAIQSIRNSRAVVLSEPALGAAHSGAEDGVWNIKRGLSSTIPKCDSTPSKSSAALGNVWSASAFCKSFGATSFVLTTDTPYTVYLYDPDDAEGDIDLRGMEDGGYHCMSADMASGTHTVKISIKRFSGTQVGTPVTINPSSSHVASSCTGDPSQTTINGLAGPSGQDNRMIVTLTYCETGVGCNSSDTATVSLNTDAPGVPTIPTIDSTGCAQRGTGTAGNNCNGNEIYSRKVQVIVP